MAEFVICNKCLSTDNSNVPFYFTTCGHLQCEGCVAKSDKTKCVVCKLPTDLKPLTNLGPEMQPFFNSICDVLDQAKQVSTFQDYNKNLITQSLTDKHRLVKQKLYKCYKTLQGMKKENAMLRLVIQNMVKTAPAGSPMAGVLSPGNSDISSIFSRRPSSVAFSLPGQPTSTAWNNSSKNVSPMFNPSLEDSRSFMIPSQSSVSANVIEDSFDDRRISNSASVSQQRSSLMKYMSQLNLASKDKPS
ncbi:hypothetical protein PPYR_12222 [Photinus pyralis]|uniref:RING-type domain-containing protein n=1 Tax=Photinus pyralis TaxID=7054 RepID=A0A1Y1LJI6_PHOPY|nr:probable E3 SUMO-protein ligase RNF212 [Photinus pyralis]KAB0795383.1 hypothetical protein PPYR_12222 [Photinus pyralis]